jgi:hypothetical protein
MSCSPIILNSYSVTGDCSNLGTGAVYFEIAGGFTTSGYTVSEFTSTGLFPLSAGTTAYTTNNLTGGTYTIAITDACATPSPQTSYFSIFISTGSCVSIESSNTTCGLNNGSITATTTNSYGTDNYFLYETTSGYITSGNSFNNIFSNLPSGIYYVEGLDPGGCSGTSESCLIKSSTTIQYGFYVVDDSTCVSNTGSGKIYVTGITGTPPYTITWSPNANGQTGCPITGLTAGTYVMTITDSLGCTVTDSVVVGTVDPLGIVTYAAVQPSCFGNDGELTVFISGGTGPYCFSGSNGTVDVVFDTEYTFSGLPGGSFTVNVFDAGLCVASGTTSLVTPNGFNITSIVTNNSTCNSSSGSINILINNGVYAGTLQYSLVGPINQTIFTNGVCNFNNLPSGNYTLTIQDSPNVSGCIFTTNLTLDNTNSYVPNSLVTGTTCGLNNGSMNFVILGTPTLPITYTINGGTPNVNLTQSSALFTNLSSGVYNVTTTDAAGCVQNLSVVVPSSEPVDFNFTNIDPVVGNDGEIYLNILSGSPLFTISWSPNVGLQTGTHLVGLSADTYTVTVTDKFGCTKVGSTQLFGTTQYFNSSSFTVCSDDFVDSGVVGKRGLSQMLNEGFYDLTINDVNCILNSASFTAIVSVENEIKQEVFYVTNNLFDSPTDDLWVSTVENLLSQFTGIGEVNFDLGNNTAIIKTKCTTQGKNCLQITFNQLTDERVIVSLEINYDVSCVSCPDN